MNQEIIKDMGKMSYADLSEDQVKRLMMVEDEINKNRQEKIFLMAFINKM